MSLLNKNSSKIITNKKSRKSSKNGNKNYMRLLTNTKMSSNLRRIKFQS